MHLPQWAAEWAKLSGVVVVLVGFALRLKPTVVVVIAALVTGLFSGIPLFTTRSSEGLVEMLGRAFADNRLMTLFIITLPAIGISEQYGLQHEAARLIRTLCAATVARLLIFYQLFRVVMGICGIRVGGHPTFVRPIIYPMALGAAQGEGENAAGPDVERLKAASAASENYGNFYGQNLSPVQPGILLVFGVLKGLGYTVSLWRLVLRAVPIALLTVIVGAVQFWLLGRRFAASRAESHTHSDHVHS